MIQFFPLFSMIVSLSLIPSHAVAASKVTSALVLLSTIQNLGVNPSPSNQLTLYNNTPSWPSCGSPICRAPDKKSEPIWTSYESLPIPLHLPETLESISKGAPFILPNEYRPYLFAKH